MTGEETKVTRSGTPQQPVWTNVFRWCARIALGLSLALLVGVCLCFGGRWDAVAVITLPPFWGWATAGVLLVAVAWRIQGGWPPKVLLALWIGASLLFSDDLLGLILTPFRSLARSTRELPGSRIRVVSLNCASQSKAAEETRLWKPDIVLLQESPSSNEVARLCQEWFGREGGFLYGLDCSIIARGQIKMMASPRSLRFNWGRVTLPGGGVLDVVSVRLLPPDIRFDLWSPDCWAQHRRGREIRRAQLQALVSVLQPGSARGPLIVGGDFNAPAGDAIFRLLRGPMKECFREAGRGWGNTGINICPISRPDQVWINQASVPLQARACKTENSDHRMVICDVVLR
jgi:vancomycin resistance protein VanJ